MNTTATTATINDKLPQISAALSSLDDLFWTLANERDQALKQLAEERAKNHLYLDASARDRARALHRVVRGYCMCKS